MTLKPIISIVFLFLACVSMAQQVIRGPYLQIGTPSSVVIKWRTDMASRSKVSFGTAASQLSNFVTDTNTVINHEIKLTGLQPNTVYYYSIGTLTTVLQGNTSNYFKTAPVAGSTQKMRFWAMGDMGDGSTNQANVRDKYLSYVSNDNKNTDLVLLLGDNAYPNGFDNEYQDNFFVPYQNHFLKNNVLWPVPGNHEYYAGPQTSRTLPYYQIFSLPQNAEAGGIASGQEAYYSFNYGNVHVVALDSYGIEDNLYRMSDTLSPQVVWLKKDLAANTLPWTIVMFHHPPHTKNSHDSDIEFELALIRRNLNPILERYKVDLVLSGHSHIYERSKQIKGHFGFSNSYSDAVHAISNSTARYDGSTNSCPYTNKVGGTVYAVVGSSGRNNGIVGTWHPAMAYTNQLDGGSLAIEIENNRIDAKWINSSGVIQDQFTLFKNVSKSTTLSPNYGTNLQLSPSWKGTYKWPDNSTNGTFSINATKDTVITVKDSQNCLADQFTIKVQNVPRVTATTPTTTALCAGSNVSVGFTTSGINAPARNFTLQFSDNTGSFNAPTVLASSKTSPISATIPATIAAGNGYKFRVITDTLSIDYAPTSAITVYTKPSATLSGNTTINVGDSTLLNIAFTGTSPWTYALSNANSGTSSTNPLKGFVKPTITTTYNLVSVSNICGAGTISGSAVVKVIPRISTANSLLANVCAGATTSLPFTLTGAFDTTNVSYTAQLSDATGNFTNPINIGTNAASPISITIPANTVAGASYKTRIIASAAHTTVTSPVFAVKPRPTATLSGDATINVGDSTLLNIVFTGDGPWTYSLTNGVSGTTSTNPQKGYVKPSITTTYVLSSVANNCGTGTVSGNPKVTVIPRISSASLSLGNVCVGSDVSVPFVFTGAFDALSVNYTAQLSDANGNFTNPINIGTGLVSPISAKIPAGSVAGSGYKVRVIASSAYTTVSSAAFAIRPLPIATITGSPTINFGDAATLNLTFTGDAPWSYTLSDGTTGTANATPATVSVKPNQTSTITVSAVKNACGNGTASGSATITVIPRLATENFPTFVCAGDIIDVKFGLGGVLPTNTTYQVQMSDSSGNFSNPVIIGSGTISPIVSTIPVTVLSANKYRARVIALNNSNINVLPSNNFIVRRKATAMLSGGGVTIKPAEEAIIVIQFGGDAPWTYQLSDNSTATTSASTTVLSVYPNLPTTYTLKSVNNACGTGIVSGAAVVNVIILSIDSRLTDEVKLYPNPAQENVNLEIQLAQPQSGDWQLLNQSGQVLESGSWKKQLSYKTGIDLRDSVSGTYFVRVRVGDISTVRKLLKQ